MTGNWMHYAVYPGAPTLLDRVILDVVEPAVSQATGIESALRWFFLRYTDGLGVHVRLRFSGTAEALHEVSQCVVPAMREELRDIAEGRTEADCRPGFYEPEIDKYGGPQGLAAAERLFQASSEFALAVIRHGARADRRIWALAAMATTGRAMLPGRPVDLMRFWRRYERYWSAQGEGSARIGRPLSRGSFEADVGEIENRLASVAAFPEIAAAFDRWQRELRIHRRVLSDLRLATADSAFHQVHLLNNRLGVPPAAEASLTRVVHSLVSLESPPATSQHHPARRAQVPTSIDERHAVGGNGQVDAVSGASLLRGPSGEDAGGCPRLTLKEAMEAPPRDLHEGVHEKPLPTVLDAKTRLGDGETTGRTPVHAQHVLRKGRGASAPTNSAAQASSPSRGTANARNDEGPVPDRICTIPSPSTLAPRRLGGC